MAKKARKPLAHQSQSARPAHTDPTKYDEAFMDDLLNMGIIQDGKMHWATIDPSIWESQDIEFLRDDMSKHLITKLVNYQVEDFERTYLFMRDLLDIDMESLRLTHTVATGISILMSPFQLAFMSRHLGIMLKLFDLALAASEKVARGGIDAPIPILTHFLPHFSTPQPEIDGINYVDVANRMADRIVYEIAVQNFDSFKPEFGYFPETADIGRSRPDLYRLLVDACDRLFAKYEKSALAHQSLPPATDAKLATKSTRL